MYGKPRYRDSVSFSETNARPLRGRAREAQHNDDAILQAAREVFGEYGWGAPMAEIASRAHTGVASIYRRYPSKTDLVNAIRVHSLEQICQLAERCGSAQAGLSPDDSAVALLLRTQIESAAMPLAPTFGRHVSTTPQIDRLADRLHRALAAVIAADLARGCIPEGYGPADLMLTLTHLRPPLATSRERATQLHLRELDYTLRGLRGLAAAGQALPGPASDWNEWLQLNSRDAGSGPR